MKKNIEIPQMGESISEGVVGAFLKESGSYVQENEEIVEIETEKVNQVLYAPAAGRVTWSVNVGDTLPVGAVIGTIDTEVEAPPVEKEEKKVIHPPPKVEGGIRKGEKEFLQELAKPEQKVEPVESKPSKKESRKRMTKIRQTIARRMIDALHNAAMLTTFNEADMSTIIFLRKKYKEKFLEKHGVKLGFMSFFVKAVVDALKEFPEFNSYIDGEEIVQRNTYDIGIAIGTERGVIVPVIRSADQLSFAQIEQQIIDYAQKARGGGLAISDLEGGGFTITNGGVYGSLLSTPILNPPQVGILGMHKIQERPIALEGNVTIRPMMYLALSYDHRIVDGKEAVSFLVHIKERLEDPSGFLFDG